MTAAFCSASGAPSAPPEFVATDNQLATDSAPGVPSPGLVAARSKSPHSRGNQLARLLWRMVYCLFFRPSPRCLQGWRRWLLRCFGARVGRHVRTFPNIKVWAPWNLQLGDDCCLGDGVDCYSVGRLVVGAHATVSQYSVLCTATHDHTYLHCPLRVGTVTIQPYAWVCAQVFIMPDVTVGEGTVVGVRSTVLRSLPSWKVAAGTPCRVVGNRQVKFP